MTTLLEPAAAVDADHRGRAVSVAAAVDEQAPAWERAGHLPAALFETVAASGILRDRWAAGPAGGLPIARALVEELAPRNGGAALAVSIHSEVFLHALHRFGGAAQAQLRHDAEAGRAIGCAAFTEPGGGSDLYAMSTAATRSPDGWHLTGVKRYTTNVGTASHVLVLARTGSSANAFTLFVVPLDRPGVERTRFIDTMGMRSADTGGLRLDVALEPGHVLGRPDAGLMYALKLLDYERLAAAVALVAGGRSALALATAHLRERQQFGKRLFDHQALAHRLADRWADLEAAAALIDAVVRDARGDHLSHHRVAAAKLICVRAGIAAIDEAIQFLGARGYTEEYPLERMYRDARLARIGGGTDEVLRQIIGMHLDAPDPAASAALHRLRDAAEQA